MPKRVFPSLEYGLLDNLKPFLNYRKSAIYPLGIGDDAAIRACKAGERLVLTADTLVEDVHFSLDFMSFEEIGYKAMAVNLSDCAAMGAVPDGALVQIIFPKKGKKVGTALKRIYKGLNSACRAWDFPIVGGNLSAGPCWIVDITLVGRAGKGSRLLLRTGARDKDVLWATGYPGESGAGLAALWKWGKVGRVPAQYASLVKRHLRPVPRIEIGLALGKDPLVHAAIDISDGVSKECHTLSFDNRLGIILDIDPLCVSSAMLRLAKRLGRDWREWFLSGGEDYELLFTASRRFDPSRLIRSCGVPVTAIGFFSAAHKGVSLRGDRGTMAQVNKNGWDHLQKTLLK
jgi:thiamine-monophosphate kinase